MRRTFLCILVVIVCLYSALAGCMREECEYMPSKYTKEEVLSIFQENRDLFYKTVSVLTDNSTFYEKGRINEYTDADIISPHDDAMKLFSDTEKDVLMEMFTFCPYMLQYDYARRFVTITFLGADKHEGYMLLFWCKTKTEGEDRFEAYIKSLTQDYFVERIPGDCILYYR